MTVLVVDDHEEFRDTLRDALEDEGYRVAVAADGRQALLRLAEITDPCLVILDLIMPAMSGEEVVERMKADSRLSSVPVIVATSDPSRAPAGLRIMKKPIDLARLLESVKGYCSC